MHQKKTLTILVLFIALFAIAASTSGIFSNAGEGSYQYASIRGKVVTIYGKGLYKDMSAEVAPQGIAQDYITLFIGVPLLLFSLFQTRKGSLRGRYLVAGTLGYFLVTYLFYLVMGMYNAMFMVYVLLAGLSFFSFLITLLTFDIKQLASSFSAATPVKTTGRFLMFNSIAIALLWLSITVPPLLNGTIIPEQVEHYTTLVVQGLDLAILLPAAFIIGWMFTRKRPLGYLLCPVYFVFLSLLMTALCAKIIAMALFGYNVIPVVFIIPIICLLTIISTIAIIRQVNDSTQRVEQKANTKAQSINLLQQEGS